MAELKEIVTQKMVGIVLATIFCVGSAAAYVEFRASKNAGEVRAEVMNSLNAKYNFDAGIRLEILVDQQNKTIDSVIKNQNDLIKLTDKVNTSLQVLASQVDNLKTIITTK